MIKEKTGLISREDVEIALDMAKDGDMLYLNKQVSGWIYKKKLYLIGQEPKVTQVALFLEKEQT